jgi:hypothetical protein
MTKAQKQKVLEVISKDCTLTCEYFGENGVDACVIGGLIIAAGKSDQFPTNVRDHNGLTPRICNDLCEYTRLMQRILFETYGLTGDMLREMQCLNDSQILLERRRAFLARFVSAIPTTD